MPINLSRIGHAAVRVRDIERAKKFYTDVLGFVIEEEDPEHGGVFMSLGRDDTHEGHVFDLTPVEDPDNALEAPERNQVGVAHIAIKVDTHQDMKDAYDHLLSNGVTVDRLVEHANQRSMYFADSEGNRLEIYFEYPIQGTVQEGPRRPRLRLHLRRPGSPLGLRSPRRLGPRHHRGALPPRHRQDHAGLTRKVHFSKREERQAAQLNWAAPLFGTVRVKSGPLPTSGRHPTIPLTSASPSRNFSSQSAFGCLTMLVQSRNRQTASRKSRSRPSQLKRPSAPLRNS